MLSSIITSKVLWLSVLSFVTGIPAAFAWGQYNHHLHELNENDAAAWDIVICLLSVVSTLTSWHHSGDNSLVLIAYAFGSGFGTKLFIRFSIRRQQRDRFHEHIRNLNSDPD